MTETPAQIAARHGAICPPGLRITVCPPGAYSSEDPLAPVPLRQQIASNYKGPKLKPTKSPVDPSPRPPRPGGADREARYRAWHANVCAGMTHEEAALAAGMAAGNRKRAAQWCRDNGLAIPHLGPTERQKRKPRLPSDAEMEWLRLVKTGLLKREAARRLGLNINTISKTVRRLTAHGHVVPSTHEAAIAYRSEAAR